MVGAARAAVMGVVAKLKSSLTWRRGFAPPDACSCVSAGGRAIFKSTVEGDTTDNPTTLEALTANQLNSAVQFTFADTDHFDVRSSSSAKGAMLHVICSMQ